MAKDRRNVVRGEDIDAVLADFDAFVEDRARRIRNKNKGEVYIVESPSKPDIADSLRENLRLSLTDEIVAAVEPEAESKVPQSEFDQELIKKALAGLHAPVLKRIAKQLSLDHVGSVEDLVTRIGRHFRWNRSDIAYLILENEPEPVEERGHFERIFPLVDLPPLLEVVAQVDFVLGRYIRIGIARWFVFQSVSLVDDRLVVEGKLRTFRAGVSEQGDEPEVVPVSERERSIEMILDQLDGVLRVRRGNAAECKLAVRALAAVSDVEPLGYVPLPGPPVDGAASEFAPASLFMLDMLVGRFPRAGLHNHNLSVARFRLGEEDEDAEESEERPVLRAVRLEGRHLFDSPPACKLLAEEGRALVDISLTTLTPPRPDGEVIRVPVRVALEGDHVLALTAFGPVRSLSAVVHDAVVEAVIGEITDGIFNEEAVLTLAERIRDRSLATTPVDQADMFQESD
jgi:hypothetical protein